MAAWSSVGGVLNAPSGSAADSSCAGCCADGAADALGASRCGSGVCADACGATVGEAASAAGVAGTCAAAGAAGAAGTCDSLCIAAGASAGLLSTGGASCAICAGCLAAPAGASAGAGMPSAGASGPWSSSSPRYLRCDCTKASTPRCFCEVESRALRAYSLRLAAESVSPTAIFCTWIRVRGRWVSGCSSGPSGRSVRSWCSRRMAS